MTNWPMKRRSNKSPGIYAPARSPKTPRKKLYRDGL
jgi:hypothetical protein